MLYITTVADPSDFFPTSNTCLLLILAFILHLMDDFLDHIFTTVYRYPFYGRLCATTKCHRLA